MTQRFELNGFAYRCTPYIMDQLRNADGNDQAMLVVMALGMENGYIEAESEEGRKHVMGQYA